MLHNLRSDSERLDEKERIIAEGINPQVEPAATTQETGDLLSGLAPEIKQKKIIKRLPIESINSLMRVSRYWLKYFSHEFDWEILIPREFNIPKKTLQLFAQLVNAIEPEICISWAEVYKHLHQLKKQEEKEHRLAQKNNHLIHDHMQPDYHLSLLAICLNQHSPKLLEKFIPHDEKLVWLTIAFLAHANNHLLTLNDTLGMLSNTTKDCLLNRMFLSDNPLLIEFLFNTDYGLNFSISNSTNLADKINIEKIAETNNVAILKKALASLGPSPNQALLDASLNASSTHKDSEMFDYLLRDFGLIPKLRTLDYAVRTKSLEHVKRIVALGGLTPHPSFLSFVAVTGDVAFFCQILDEYKMKPHERALANAADAGRLELVNYITNTYELPFTQGVLELLASHCSPIETIALLKQHGLAASQSLLEVVAKRADLDFLISFIDKHQLQVSSQVLRAINNPKILLEIIKRYNIVLDAGTFNVLCEKHDLETIKYLSERFNLPLNRNSLTHGASNHRAYSVVRHHIEAGRVSIDEYDIEYSLPIAALLFHAAFAMQQAFDALEQSPSEALNLLLKAFKYSPRHFYAVAVHALLHPDEYELNEQSITILHDSMDRTADLPISIRETTEIHQLLSAAPDSRLKNLALSFSPPALTSQAAQIDKKARK